MPRRAMVTVGPRPKVRAMLQAGLPRCMVLVLMLLAYMNNIVTGLQYLSLYMECELLRLVKFCFGCPRNVVFCRYACDFFADPRHKALWEILMERRSSLVWKASLKP